MYRLFEKLNLPVIGRWFILGTIVGVVAGLGAIVFFMFLQFSSFIFIDYIAGMRLQETAGEPLLFPHATTEFKRWLLVLIPAFGGLVSGILVYSLAPEAEGHGTDAAIDVIHNKKGFIRFRVPFIKTLASAITIGPGGSGGREGPIAQIGAGFGSLLGRLLHLSDREKRILTSAGMGAGIGAIFRSPVAGAIFAAEVLYASSDMEYEILLPSTITSIVAYSVFCSMFGWSPLFSTPDFFFARPIELISYTILGFSCALVGYIYINVFYGINDIFKKLRIPNHVKPMIGGLLTGMIGYFIPEALGGGYAQIEKAMYLELGVFFLLLLLVAKILTTSFSIGSGGSGGIFGPSVVIGAALGGFVGIALNKISPILVSEPGAFVIVGMAGFFAGIAKTPLSTIIMVSEMTGNYHLLVPSMWVSTLSFLTLGRTTIYKKQEISRSDSPIHRGEFLLHILEDIKIKDVMRKDPLLINENMKFMDIVNFIPTTKHNSFPVVSKNNTLIGVLRFEEIREFIFEKELENIIVASEVCDKKSPSVMPEDTLSQAIEIIGFSNIELLPVINNHTEKILVGIITRRDIIANYNKEMIKQKQHLQVEF